jgi:CRISPR-associated endonuclease Cas2
VSRAHSSVRGFVVCRTDVAERGVPALAVVETLDVLDDRGPRLSTFRVQKSVFECLLAPEDVDVLLERLLKVMDEKKYSIRIYHLGSTMPRAERLGKEGPITTRDVMIV